MSLKQVADIVVRGTAGAIGGGASLVLLDSTHTRLIHSSSWGLPQFYLRKGLLKADKSLSEVSNGQVVVISEVRGDSRIQYPELAAKAGIASLLGVPVTIGAVTVGSLRAYSKSTTEFTQADINFVTAMANLAAMGIRVHLLEQEKQKFEKAMNEAESGTALLRQVRSVTFAHPSEEELAHILDFYQIDWVYEPRSFPLTWESDRITEMFTPDFYLPALDLYIELTTLKQSLVTEKNRKLRRLRELYPEIAINLLYKKDIHRLLAKYGCGPLAQAKGQGIGKTLFSNVEIQRRVQELAQQISIDYTDRRPIMVGILRGVFCFIADLVRAMTIPVEVEFMAISHYEAKGNSVRITKDLEMDVSGRHLIVVEDIVDTGMTLNYMLHYLNGKQPASLAVCALLDKKVRRMAEVRLDYIGFEVPDEFVVGYGLDYKDEYRNLPFIGTLESPQVEVGQTASGKVVKGG
ncbi:MAG: hypoxanthine phosphoribosyltransferase [Dehalococcoidia bacterium]|nr:hypoxanthine phosphoribosyltransferase [Dehalococcoidia bacterium]